jgi:hypothetical protein
MPLVITREDVWVSLFEYQGKDARSRGYTANFHIFDGRERWLGDLTTEDFPHKSLVDAHEMLRGIYERQGSCGFDDVMKSLLTHLRY